MNITDSEILKLKSNMGYLKKDTSRDNQPIQNDTNNNGITESAKKFNNEYELWLDKYKPNKFTELLTEEDVNRKILTWMKSWDDVVYNKKFKIPEVSSTFGFNKETSGNNLNDNETQLKKEVEYVQSKNKIILIAGPPGIGKTTLAKVLARHCGYDPLVINASDERTSDKLLLRIYDTTQMHNLNFSNKKKENKKPTCLILDEIDGVLDGADGKNAIRNILDFIKLGKVNKNIINKARKTIMSGDKENSENNFRTKAAAVNSNQNVKGYEKDYSDGSDDEEKSFRNKNKNKENNSDDEEKNPKNKNIIKRPIICICNDLYAKTLSPLRKEGLVFHLKRANPYKLLQRLKEICKLEDLNIDTNSLKNLCEKSNSDIRVCINSLQFISYNKNNIALIKTLSSEKLSILGSKDITEGLFDIWMKIFSSSHGESTSFNKTLHIYNNEYVKVNDGIFVNYLKVPKHYSRTELLNRTKLLDYLSYADTVTAKINEKHCYEMSKFQALPGAFAKKKYYVTDNKLNLEFPTLINEFKTHKKINSRIISSIKETFEENNIHSKISKKGLVCNVLPYMFQLMQPSIREINTELMNKNEIKQLRTAINVMYNFGMKFKEKLSDDLADEDTVESVFEPDIQRLLNFTPQKVSPNPNVDHEHFNICESLASLRMTPKQRLIMKNEFEKVKSFKENIKDKSYSSSVLNANKPNTDNALNRPEHDIPVKDAKGKFSFFHPLSKRNQQGNKPESNSINFADKSSPNSANAFELGKKRNFSELNNPEYKFVYKYNEGVTNTVRRTLNINYFFK